MRTCWSTSKSRLSAASSSTTIPTTPTRPRRSASTPSITAARPRLLPPFATSAWHSDAAMAGNVPTFEHWLAEGGLRNRPLTELFNGFTKHLVDAGLPLSRVYFGMSTRHPLIQAFDMTWEPEE